MHRRTGILSPLLALLSAAAAPAPKSAATDVASPKDTVKPMVIQNPDGTITVRKELSKGEAKTNKGLFGVNPKNETAS